MQKQIKQSLDYDSDKFSQSSCPFMKKQNKENKSKGGCPFMSSNSVKNPNLKLNHQGYPQVYISPYAFELGQNIFSNKNIKRKQFSNYPIYLKHSLFYVQQQMIKARSLDCCSRYMPFDYLKQKGNQFWWKQEYGNALEMYQRAYSLFKYLSYQKPEAKQPENKFQQFELQMEKVFKSFNDETVSFHKFEGIEDKPDTQMAQSMLMQCFINISAVYIKLNNFQLAIQVNQFYKILNEGQQILNPISILYFRRSQARTCNLASSIEQLYESKKDIEIAIEKKKQEKIFTSTKEHLLKMVNLHDANESYQQQRILVNKRIQQKNKYQDQIIMSLLQRAKQIQGFEQDIIKAGKIPQQNLSYQPNRLKNNYQEYELIVEMDKKYLRLIKFQKERQKDVKGIKKEYQQFLKTKHNMQDYLNINFVNPNDKIKQKSQLILINLTNQKILKRLQYIKKQQYHIYQICR